MNKEKYLKELEKRLEYLNDEQKQQEIFRVSNELDSGNVMNDLSNEVDSIYKKYNINVKRQEKINNNSILTKFDNFKNKIKNNTWKENLTILKDFIVIILIVSIVKIPFIGVETLLFSIFENKISDKTYTIINYGLEGIYVVLAIMLFIKLFKDKFKEEMS